MGAVLASGSVTESSVELNLTRNKNEQSISVCLSYIHE